MAFAIKGVKGSLSEGVSYIVALDAHMGSNFEDIYREGVRLYLFEDVVQIFCWSKWRLWAVRECS